MTTLDAERESQIREKLRLELTRPSNSMEWWRTDDSRITLLLRLLDESRAEAEKHKAKVSELAATVGELQAEIARLHACGWFDAAALFTAIAHGDDTHRQWLLDALRAYRDGQPIPVPRSAPPAADALTQAQEIVAAAIKRADHSPRADPDDLVHLAQRVLDEITAGIARALTSERPEADVMEWVRELDIARALTEYSDQRAREAIEEVEPPSREVVEAAPNLREVDFYPSDVWKPMAAAFVKKIEEE